MAKLLVFLNPRTKSRMLREILNGINGFTGICFLVASDEHGTVFFFFLPYSIAAKDFICKITNIVLFSLIPNLSYVSEAAAYVLDCQLRTNLVPYTDVVWLSSKSFHYPFWDRRNFYRKKRPFPAKPGSFQVFLKGFKDANVFLREHPWPDQYWSGFRANETHRTRKKRWTESCRPSTSGSPEDADSSDDETAENAEGPSSPPRFVWTEQIKQSFREELEKLVILDYIMRNTDRGLDNWMVKVDWETGAVSLVSDPIQMNMETPQDDEDSAAPRPVDLESMPQSATTASYPYKIQKPMNASSNKLASKDPAMSLGAIDNSLSWPWKHPDAWRRLVCN